MCLFMDVSVGIGHEIRKGIIRGARGLKGEGQGVQYTCMEMEGLHEREASRKMCQSIGDGNRRAGETKTKYVTYV